MRNLLKLQKCGQSVSTLFDKAGDTQDITYINQASEILVDLSKKRKSSYGIVVEEYNEF
jgi:hypothetical protein